MLSLSEALHNELKDDGITVTTLCPGATKTQFANTAHINFKGMSGQQIMTAKEVARIGYDAMMKGKRVIIPGISNKIQVCLMKLVPTILILKIIRSMYDHN